MKFVAKLISMKLIAKLVSIKFVTKLVSIYLVSKLVFFLMITELVSKLESKLISNISYQSFSHFLLIDSKLVSN